MDPVSSLHGALALELKPGAAPGRLVLDQDAAEALAAGVANDLARFDARAADFDLGLLAAAYDPVELLRPRWPLHRELERLVAQAPGAGLPRVIAFADREGRLPGNLLPHADYAGGAFRLLPFVLRGPRAQCRRSRHISKRCCWKPAWPTPGPRSRRSRPSALPSSMRAT
jgi:hypothetical protein